MNTGESNRTKSCEGPSTVSSSLQLRTGLVDWCPAGWEPGVAWQWWLADFAALLCGAGGSLQPNVPQVCWFAEAAEPVRAVILLLFSSNSHPKPGQGPLLAEELLLVWLLFCLTAPWELPVSAGHQKSEGPHGSAWASQLSLMEEGWSLRLEGRAASCQIGSALWEKHPLVHGNGPTMVHPSWFKLLGAGSLLSWKRGAEGRAESRQPWGKQGGTGGCSRVGQLFRWHSLSWGKARHQTKSCQFFGFSHPGLFGVAETVFDVLSGVVLLGHWDS